MYIVQKNVLGCEVLDALSDLHQAASRLVHLGSLLLIDQRRRGEGRGEWGREGAEMIGELFYQ